jgi:hypothetical protein
MKMWVLAGFFTAVTIPLAAASEDATECQVDNARQPAQVRIDSGGSGGSAPPARARTTSAPRETPAQVAQREADEAERAAAERRRNGKRIPDAELIGPRGAL